MSVHSTAVVDPRAVVDATATIGPHVVIEGPVRIGAGCEVGPCAVIVGDTEIGARTRIHSHTTIGDVPQDRAYTGGVSYCRIGEDCIIREGVTIHRGTAAGTTTTVGNRCHLMTNSHVGHNCSLADDVLIISGVLLGGYVQIGPKAVLAGGAAVHQFVRIGELAMVSGLAKVVQDVPPFALTDRDGGIIGENRIGMLRAGLSTAERAEIKTAFRIIYRSGLSHAAALAELQAQLSTGAGQRLLEFMANASKRGVTRESIPLRRVA